MDPSERARLEQAIDLVLNTIARETGKEREWLGLEIEQVVTRAVFDAHRIGAETRKRHTSTAIPAVRDENEDK